MPGDRWSRASKKLGDPVEDDDFRRAIDADRESRPTDSSVDVEAMLGGLVEAAGPALTAGRKPEDGNVRESPLAGVTVSAERQIHPMPGRELLQNVGRMGEKQGKTSGLR